MNHPQFPVHFSSFSLLLTLSPLKELEVDLNVLLLTLDAVLP